MSANNLNPAIVVWAWGKRRLTEVNLYPLSVGDQGKATDIISAVISEYAQNYSSIGDMEDAGILTALYGILQKNLPKIVALVCDVDEAQATVIANEMTNTQLMQFCHHVWEMNYEDVVKNVKRLMAGSSLQTVMKGMKG